MKGQDIADRFVFQMNDPGNVRYTSAEVLGWINAGQVLIALVRPDAASVNETLTLAAGTKQTLPAGGLRLLDIVRAIHPTTSAPLRAVTYCDRHILDSANPLWHSATSSDRTAHYVYDERDPKTFYVYPPAKSTTKVEAIYTKAPAAITALNQDLALDDIYADPLLEYTLFRAYSFDREYSLQPQLAAQRLAIFNQMLGVKVARDRALSPDLNSRGAAPSPGLTAGA